MIEHDLVAPLGHDRQFGARLVGPHADAEETETEFGADFLHLLQMPAGLGAGLVEVFERRAGEFELARGLEADGAVAARQRDDPPVFWAALDHRFPAEAGERSEEHTSELQSLMRNSYAAFCLKKKKIGETNN